MRITAQIDKETRRRLSYLERETGWSVSKIVRRAIDAYHTSFKAARTNPAKTLARSGFIGCARGPADLSVTYKKELRRLINKRGDR